MTPNNQPVNQAFSIDSLLALRSSLRGDTPSPTVKPKPTKKPIDISLEKYQEAVDFYADHPNQEMHESYLESLSICKTLKEAFELSEEIAKETTRIKRKRLKGMEREESLSSLLMQRVTALESIQYAKSKLAGLKQQRVTLKNKKPH